MSEERRKELAAQGLTLRWWAEQTPGAPAIVSEHGNRTFAELDGRANQLVRALRVRGVTAGDAIALICANRPEFAEVVAACNRAGYRLTTINWHLTGDEAAYIVGDCEAKALVADADLAATAITAAANAPLLSVKFAVGGAIDGFESYDAAVGAERDGLIDDPTPGSQMLYTSGTTGRPKGVHRPPAAAGAVTAVNIYGYAEGGGDVHLCTGPLYHAAPLAFSLAAPLAFGARVVLMEKWDAEEALRLIDAHKVTHTHMVPTMFHRLLSLPDDVRAKYDASSLRYVLHGAAPCPVPVKQQLIEWLGPIVTEYYAATEGVGSFVNSEIWL
ncbi:MAG TPA: AMP-binding protein, partial [Acidimicrobiia bacterium]